MFTMVTSSTVNQLTDTCITYIILYIQTKFNLSHIQFFLIFRFCFENLK